MYPPGYVPYAPPGSYGTYPPALAERSRSQPDRVGMYEHDGFFLRLALGFGAGGTTYREPIGDVPGRSAIKTRGVVGSFELAVGGRVWENLILHGSLIASGISSNRRVDGVEDQTYDDLSTRTVLFGGGATYYLMPTNLYFTLNVGTAFFEEERDDDRNDERMIIESGAGVGGALTIGKEWWVGSNGQWGIGASITGSLQGAPVDIALEDTWARSHHVSLNFSTTYN